jgi:hypothetical protein
MTVASSSFSTASAPGATAMPIYTSPIAGRINHVSRRISRTMF